MASVRFVVTLLLAVLAVSVRASAWWDDNWDLPSHHYHHHHHHPDHHGHFPSHHGHFHHHHQHHGGHHSDHGGWKWD